MLSGADIPADLKRLSARAWRRGTKEMDLILGPYADAALPTMTGAERTHFAALLEELDSDLYAWVTGSAMPPPEFQGAIHKLKLFHRID